MEKMSLFFVFLMVLRPIIAQHGSAISEAANAFSINLLAGTLKEAGDRMNVATSPYTIWTLMSIIAEGANGNTAKELEKALNIFPDKSRFRADFESLSRTLSQRNDGDHVTTEISNAIFTTTEQSLLPQFQQVAKKYYNVDVEPTNFRDRSNAMHKINTYVAKATRNRIKDFVNAEDLSDAQIFLTSALFFKGRWATPFNATATHDSDFFDEAQRRIGTVKMMYQVGPYPYARIDALQAYAVELPYGNKTSMIVIIPYRGETTQNVLERLEKRKFTSVLNTLERFKEDFAEEDVQLYLPRFSITSEFNLNVVLARMGIKDVFDEQKAELLGIFPHYLYVSRVLQKAEIEVNEEGTIASSASGISLSYKSPPPKFLADRPFLYFIVDKKASSIVFAGRLSVPPHK